MPTRCLKSVTGRQPRPTSCPTPPMSAAPLESSPVDQLIGEGRGDDDRPLDIDVATLDRDRDTGDADWGSDYRVTMGAEGPGIDEQGDGPLSLAEHLAAQIAPAARDPREAFVARHIVGLLDEAGYLPVGLDQVAADLGVSATEAEAGLALVQSLDPTGTGARSLSECLALQAKEADRHDPCMARLLDNLELLARGELARLKRICGVDDEDFAEMMAELRGYDPKPGLRFGYSGASR